ncbi:hypothetical protein WA158_001639 [Blastocystis sp. Blastoise]
MKFYLVFAIFVALAAADKWAVLLAGSKGFQNYRHQADLCHMYHVLTDHGMNPEHIITIMADDIANNEANIFPGTIFNHPGENPRNYYEGVVIDYKDEVSAEVYYAILKGDAEKVKELTGKTEVKTLNSGPTDTVFFYFIDHGGSGIVCMPDDKTYLKANELQAVLKELYETKKYSKAVYYMEACESGSMWLDLPTDINLYAVSSTLPDENSWGTYCPGEEVDMNDLVRGKHIGTCLGEVWSCSWLEQDDDANLATLTLQKQFDDSAFFTTTSTSVQYGDLSWTNITVGDFISETNFKECKSGKKQIAKKSWSSRDNSLLYWEYRMKQGDSKANEEYEKEVMSRKEADTYFSTLIKKFNGNNDTYLSYPIHHINWKCYNNVLDKYLSNHKFTDYSLQYTHTLAFLCSTLNGNGQEIVDLM